MSVLAVIPARLGATRLPNKPLRLLGGEPLITRVLARVLELGVANDVVVAADHPDVRAAVERAGGRCVDTRPDHPSGTDRVAEVAARPEFRRYEVVLNVQGDEPFVARAALHGAVAMCDRFDLGTAAVRAGAEVLANPNAVKVVCDDQGRAMYFSRAPIPWLRDRADEAVLGGLVRLHVGIYAYRREALARWVALPLHALERAERLEQLRPLAAGLAMGVHVLDGPLEGGIDTEEDLARANARWADLDAARS
jgi:3-deoxy-manno-octulosonate cytidylyltransferase (CMP-KDO synthetase)